MKLSNVLITAFAVSSVSAFQPITFVRSKKNSINTVLYGFDLSGNSWKPDSEKMGSTDVGDYFPEGYDPNEVAFTEGMRGSQELLTDGDRGGPQLPGLENLGADAVIAGGINMVRYSIFNIVIFYHLFVKNVYFVDSSRKIS